MPTFQAVLFDLDNTILDRNRSFGGFVQAFLDTYLKDHPSNYEFYDRIMELDQDGYKDRRVLFGELLDELPWPSKPQVSELMDYFMAEYVKQAKLMDQAIEVLRYMRKKYKTGLITNGGTIVQHGKIDQLGIRDEFDVIVVSQDVGVKKPDQKIFEIAISKLGLQPRDCIMIGDHPVNDIEGAAHAGIETIWFRMNQPWHDHIQAKPLRTITHLGELLDVL